MTKQGYYSTFLRPKSFHTNHRLYISPENHRKLLYIISAVSHTSATLSSYVDAIISEHLRTHASLLAEIHTDATAELFGDTTKTKGLIVKSLFLLGNTVKYHQLCTLKIVLSIYCEHYIQTHKRMQMLSGIR